MVSPSPDTTTQHAEQRAYLMQAGRLHWFHWLIVGLSLLLTLSAWRFTQTEHQEKMQIRFGQEISRVQELLVERMQKYEDGLLSGVAFLQTTGIDADFLTWKRYAEAIGIQKKYPGINGIGVIHAVARDPQAIAAYLAWQQQERPDFFIHPVHTQPELLPISYTLPIEANARAVGLDIAHEANRYRAAVQARETGQPQITGPIVLVQDVEQTPGFLFYAPFYREDGAGQQPQTEAERIDRFAGMVYAPFVMHKLIDGALRPEQRLVHIRLRDGESVLYDELDPDALDHDGAALFSERMVLPMYGRTWALEVQTTQRFRQAVDSRQPVTILAVGLVIDGLLLWFFLAFSQANRRAVAYADEMVEHLRASERVLAQANDELLQLNYRTSHDLVAPLSTIRGFVSLAQDDAAQGDLAAAVTWIAQIDDQCRRLIGLVGDLAELSRAQHGEEAAEAVDLVAMVGDIQQALGENCRRQGVEIRTACALDRPLQAAPRRLRRVLECLISNAVRYASPARSTRWVEIRAQRRTAAAGGGVALSVADNGIGIPAEFHERVFTMFFRGPGASAEGSGLGLYIVRQHVDKMGAELRLQSSPEGSVFTILFPEE